MRKVEEIERQIRELSSHEFTELRNWFLEQDWTAWDQQLEADSRDGKLDSLAAAARRAHAEGKSTKL
jgi:hypothetical protein